MTLHLSTIVHDCSQNNELRERARKRVVSGRKESVGGAGTDLDLDHPGTA